MTVRQRIKRRPSIAKREFKAAPPEFADGSLICRDMRKVTPNAELNGARRASDLSAELGAED